MIRGLLIAVGLAAFLVLGCDKAQQKAEPSKSQMTVPQLRALSQKVADGLAKIDKETPERADVRYSIGDVDIRQTSSVVNPYEGVLSLNRNLGDARDVIEVIVVPTEGGRWKCQRAALRSGDGPDHDWTSGVSKVLESI